MMPLPFPINSRVQTPVGKARVKGFQRRQDDDGCWIFERVIVKRYNWCERRYVLEAHPLAAVREAA